MEWIFTGIIVALLTLFDLDQTFYIPSNTEQKIRLYAWWWGFIIANSMVASLLYYAVADIEAIQKIQPEFRGVAVGLGYLALVRAKLTTLKVQDKEVPLGIELFYEGAKTFVYKRINRIAKQARREETKKYVQENSLKDLELEAKLDINQDALLTETQKKEWRDWVDKVVKDKNKDDIDKRIALAIYIKSGQKSNY